MQAADTIVDTLRGEGAVLRETPWGPVAVDFGDWQAEYRAFRQAAGLFRPPSATQVEIAGRDRAAFLNRLATNQLDQIRPGEGCETFLADANGRILHHVFVFAGPHALVLHTTPGQGSSLCAHLDHYWIREDLKFHDRSDEWGQLVLAGPKAAEIVERLTSSGLPDDDAYLANFEVSWNGRPLMVRRFQERGFQSFHLASDAADMEPLWLAVRQLGAVACGMKALETIRIEEGFPVVGLDITDKNLPQEVGRNEKAISFTKGCYLGQEIVARIDSRGAVSKVLRGLRFQTADVPGRHGLVVAGGELTHDGQAAGQITSAAYSPGFEANVALGYIRRPVHEIGTVLDSAWGPATVVELPLR
jgi:tRNA-modifying protein YgfZ